MLLWGIAQSHLQYLYKNNKNSMLEILPLNAFDDNYIWCITSGNRVVVVDPGDADPVLDFIRQHQLVLEAIIVTHHHHDHINGIPRLTEHFPSVPVYGPHSDRIKAITHPLNHGDNISLLCDALALQVLHVPGHTREHIAYHNDNYLFCGDTLFSAGCGRMFEGTPQQFWHSLRTLRSLGDHLEVYCTHEYTEANIKFAHHLEPNNPVLSEFMHWVSGIRRGQGCTLPTTIKKEKAVNPFLRCDVPEFVANIKHALDVNSDNATDVFAAVRAAKDNY